MGRRSKYPEECRRNAAKLAPEGGRSIRDVAGELGINHQEGARSTLTGYLPAPTL